MVLSLAAVIAGIVIARRNNTSPGEAGATGFGAWIMSLITGWFTTNAIITVALIIGAIIIIVLIVRSAHKNKPSNEEMMSMLPLMLL